MGKRKPGQDRALLELRTRLKRFTDAFEEQIAASDDDLSLHDILTPKFLQKHTKCQSFTEFQSLFPFDLLKEELTPGEVATLDAYIRKRTKFGNWAEFICVAIAQHATDQAVQVTTKSDQKP